MLIERSDVGTHISRNFQLLLRLKLVKQALRLLQS